ncbi:CMGC/CDK protein kinase [Lasiodiplodia theobromae]|nr:CMGC/CDK protein kinase [Lasiodiplodia theobromae]
MQTGNNHSEEEPIQSDSVPSDPETIRNSRSISHSNHQNPTPSNTPTVSDGLYDALHDARIEDPLRLHHWFIPESAKDQIITKEAIAQEIRAACADLNTAIVDEIAEVAHSRAKNLFAILAYMRKGGEILKFLEERIFDEDLPLERGANGGKGSFSLKRKDEGGIVQVLERWESSSDREAFSRDQWLMLSPVFKDMEHYVLHQCHVLPFIPLGPGDVLKDCSTRAGYSEVFPARIHEAHHRFHQKWSQEDGTLHVAVKKLLTKDRERFENEQSILQKLGSKSRPHLHLVKLLASYEVNGEFFFIFPRAHCNLRTYWEEHPRPELDKDTLRWSLDQMRGIATALYTIHHFRVTHPLIVEGKVRTPQTNVKLKVSPGEEFFGRHGDIKPENIIWFENIPDLKYGKRGVLQITDFGLGRFHGRDSKTEHPPHHVVGSPTYEPPECRLQQPVSRKYDIWSLGCLYIEFITWLLKGSQYIDTFSDRRGQQSSIDLFSDDYFFTTEKRGINGEKKYAYVRDGVITWVQNLHDEPRCSEFLHDVLDLIMDELLKVDAAERIETGELCRRFHNFSEKVHKSDEYLVEACPRKVRGTKSQSALKPKRSRRSVTFSDEPEILDLQEFRQNFKPSLSPDPLGRNRGTPGHPAFKGKSRTFPQTSHSFQMYDFQVD